jgi:hypothetical protein
MCGFYGSLAEQIGQAADFLVSGLRAHEACFLAAAPDVAGQVLRAIPADATREGPGAVTVIPTSRDRPLGGKSLGALARLAEGRGASGICFVGDMSALQQQAGLGRIVALEARCEQLVHRFPARLLCLYDVRSLSGIQANALLRAHPDVFRPPVELIMGSLPIPPSRDARSRSAR